MCLGVVGNDLVIFLRAWEALGAPAFNHAKTPGGSAKEKHFTRISGEGEAASERILSNVVRILALEVRL